MRRILTNTRTMSGLLKPSCGRLRDRIIQNGHSVQSRNFAHTKTPSSQSPNSASVSQDEVSKFSSMAPTWWDHHQNPLIGMNPARVERIVHVVRSRTNSGTIAAQRPLEGLRALDVGCGGGLLSESLARLGAEVTAIDPSAGICHAAREHAAMDPATAGIDYRGGISVEDLAAEFALTGDDDTNLFDVVCILDVIEHATNPEGLLNSAASLLKRDGGTLFVSTLNRTPKSFLLAIVGAEYVSNKLPVGTHDWNRFLSPEEVKTMAGSVGLKTVDVCGMVIRPSLPPFQWGLDEGDTDINWIGAYVHRD